MFYENLANKNIACLFTFNGAHFDSQRAKFYLGPNVHKFSGPNRDNFSGPNRDVEVTHRLLFPDYLCFRERNVK